MYKFILNFLLLLPMCIYSQNYKSDIDSLNVKASKYVHIDLDSAFIFASKAIEKSKISRYTVGEMEGKYQLGRVYFDQARRTLSIQAGEHSLAIAEEIDSYIGKKNALNLIAKIQNHANELEEGIKTVRRNFNLAKAQGDSIEMALMANFKGIFKYKMEENDSAFYFTMQSMKINSKLGDDKALAYNFNSLGIRHYKNRNLDSSFYYFRRALKIRTDLKLPNQSVEAYNNLGYVFLKEGIVDSAIVYFKKCIDVCLGYGKKQNLAIAYANISEAYEISGNNKAALIALQNAIPINDSLAGIKQKEQIIKTQEAKNEELKLRNVIINVDKQKQFLLILVLILLFITFFIVTKTSRKRSLLTALAIQKTKASQELIDEYEKIDNWIARELHDDIGGSIAAIRLNMLQTLEVVKKAHAETVKLGKLTFEMDIFKLETLVKSRASEISSLEMVNQNIRKLSHTLAPVTFKGQSFIGLIEQKITDIFPKNQKVTIQCLPEDELNEIEENLKFNIYRILQNLSTNIIIHANATEADIQVIGHKDHLNIVVEDNGDGFEKDKATDGIGLQLIKKRVFLKNGAIEINSQKGKGTTIIIEIPYKNSKI